MPKGVEHAAMLASMFAAPGVPQSEMPKGVEHMKRRSGML
jgi:hypothetical protein